MAAWPSRQRVVWIVDDSPLDAERARRTLASQFAVKVFGDGSSLLEHLSSHEAPDLIVLDWIMPGVSGVEVCRFLRSSQAAWANVAVLLLTAHQKVEEIVEGLAAGANDYLSKPYAPEELLARVAAQLRTRELLERAERAESSVSLLLAQSPDPFFAVGPGHVISYANAEAGCLFECHPDDLLGKPLGQVLPELVEHAPKTVKDDWARSLPDVTIRERIYSPALRRLPTDAPASTTITLRDVTDRRKADTRRLDFYSMVAHDLRGPLSAVLLRTDGLLRGRRGVLSAEALKDVRRIEANARSLVALINDFLELARLEGTGYKLEREEVDLATLISGTVDDFRPLIDASQLSLAVACLPAETKVVGDRRRLVQVLSNLLGNAIKFTPPGGEIRVQLAASNNLIETAVADTGAGIPKEAIPTLFDRFTRAVPRDRTVVGTGLGLMIVREIVEAHGGCVGVESDEGHGSRFWFRLPKVA